MSDFQEVWANLVKVPTVIRRKINPGYQNIMDYWNNKVPKPSENETFNSLLQYAENTKLENTVFHPDFIDGMFSTTLTL